MIFIYTQKLLDLCLSLEQNPDSATLGDEFARLITDLTSSRGSMGFLIQEDKLEPFGIYGFNSRLRANFYSFQFDTDFLPIVKQIRKFDNFILLAPPIETRFVSPDLVRMFNLTNILLIPVKLAKKLLGIIIVDFHQDKLKLSKTKTTLIKLASNFIACTLELKQSQRGQAICGAVKDLACEDLVRKDPEKFLSQVKKITNADFVVMFISSGYDSLMNAFYAMGPGVEKCRQQLPVPTGRGVLKAVLKGEKINLKNVREHPEFVGFPAKHPKIKAFLAVPIQKEGQHPIGGLYAARNKEEKFSCLERKNLETLARLAANTIYTTKLHLSLKTAYTSTVRALAAAVEANDPTFTYGHLTRVSMYAEKLAKQLHLDENKIMGIKAAAYLHDLGKLAISPEILNKSSKLTEEQWQIVKTHTSEGYKILSHVNFPWKVAELVKAHHERYDGKGYPDGIAGEKIPLGARIITIADSWDAMINKRPYRQALSYKEAVAELKRNKGSQFDPKLVDVFLEILDKEKREDRLIMIGKKRKTA